MDVETQLLIMYYDGKTPNSLDVQLRAPIDIFEAIKIIKKLQIALTQKIDLNKEN